jgi:hypothetical protein
MRITERDDTNSFLARNNYSIPALGGIAAAGRADLLERRRTEWIHTSPTLRALDCTADAARPKAA